MATRPELYGDRLNMRISSQLMGKLRIIAKAKGITASEMVRRLVLNYVEGLGNENSKAVSQK